MPVVLTLIRHGTGPSCVMLWKCPLPDMTTTVTKKKVLVHAKRQQSFAYMPETDKPYQLSLVWANLNMSFDR